MRFLLCVLIASVVLCLPDVARADTFTLTANGQVDTFSLPASPPITSSSDFGFTLDSVPIDEGGRKVIREIDFFTSAIGGGLLIQGNNGPDFNGQGAALYTGPNTQPIFQTGTYNLTGADFGVLVIGKVSAVPEPACSALIAAGFFGLLCLLIQTWNKASSRLR